MKVNSLVLLSMLAPFPSLLIFSSASLNISDDEPYDEQHYVPVYYHRPQTKQISITDYRPAWIQVNQQQEFYFNIEIENNSTAEDVIKAFIKEAKKRKSGQSNQNSVTSIGPFPIKRLLEKSGLGDNEDVFALVDLGILVEEKAKIDYKRCCDTIKSFMQKTSNYVYYYWDKVQEKLPPSCLYWIDQSTKILSKIRWSSIDTSKPRAIDQDQQTKFLKKIIVAYKGKIREGREYYICMIGKKDLKIKFGYTAPSSVLVNQLLPEESQSNLFSLLGKWYS